MNSNLALAAIANVIPGSFSCEPLAEFLLIALTLLGLLVFFVECFVRSVTPRPAMSGRKACRAAATLSAGLGAVHAAGFIAFAFRAKAINGGWPRAFQFYDRMQPWTAVFERSEPVLCFAGVAAGILALASAVAVFAGWRRSAALAAYRTAAALSASAFLAWFLPLLFLPGAAIDWWFD